MNIEELLEEAEATIKLIEEQIPHFPEETISNIEHNIIPTSSEDRYEARTKLSQYIDSVRRLIINLQEVRDILHHEEHNDLFFVAHIDSAINIMRALMSRASAARSRLRETTKKEQSTVGLYAFAS